MDDALSRYQQFRSQILQRWGMQDRNSQQVSGPAMSGTTQSDRFMQQANRGTAPPTVGNIMGAFGNAANLLGGMGAVMTGATSMAELGAGVKPGAWGGIQNMADWHAIGKGKLIGNLVDFHEARDSAMRSGGALDSHGQVKGGGTGSRGGGLTAGGPR